MKFEYIFFHICDFCEFHIETYSPCFILQYCEIRLYIIQNLPLLQCLFQKFFICVFSHMGQISGFYLCKFLSYSSSNIPSDFSVWNKSMKVGRQTCFQYIYCEKFYSGHYICSNFGSENFYVEQKGRLIWDAILPPSNISMLNNHHCQALFPQPVVMVEK